MKKVFHVPVEKSLKIARFYYTFFSPHSCETLSWCRFIKNNKLLFSLRIRVFKLLQKKLFSAIKSVDQHRYL